MLVGKTANAIFNLAYMAVTARALGADVFGVLVLINTFAVAVGEVVQFQSWQIVLRYGSGPAAGEGRETLQRVIRFAFLLDVAGGAVGAAFAIGVALLASRALGWPPGSTAAAVPYLTGILFMMQAMPTGVLRLFGRFDLLSVQSSVTALTRLAGAAVVWMCGGGLIAFMVAWYLGTVAAFLFLYAAAFREMARRGVLGGFDWFGGSLTGGMPGVWSFAWTTNFKTTLELVFTQAGVLIVGALLSPAAAGLFRVAWQIANAVTGLIRIVVDTLYPELARLWVKQDHAALRAIAIRVGLVCGGVSTMLLVLVSTAGGPFLGLVMGPAFRQAAPVLTWLVAAAMIGAWTLPLEALLVSTGRAGAALRIRLVAALVYLSIIAPLLHGFGLQGAGFASVAASLPMAAGLIFAALGPRRQPAVFR